MLTWISQNCSFPQLRTLRIRLNPMDLMEEIPGFDETVCTFLRMLEPLEELIISGPLLSKVLDAIISQYGSILYKLFLSQGDSEMMVSNGRKKLEIPMIFGKKYIMQIQSQCPRLQTLALPIKRTKSDIVEAGIYQCFGTFEHLEALFLTLDCSDWRVIRDSTRINDLLFDNFDREIYYLHHSWLQKGHVRDTLENCAIDEKLARSIWETICKNKRGKPLQSLKLLPWGGGHWGDNIDFGGLREFMEYLGRPWLFTYENGATHVKELRRGWRELQGESWAESYMRVPRRNDLWEVFHRIWPAKEDSKDFRDDWESLPLQL